MVDLLQDLALQGLNLSLMFSVGLELRADRLREAARRWRILLVLVGINFAVLPAAAVGVVWATRLPEAVAAGIVLAAVCPGGGTGTLLTRTGRGNLELSVVMLGAFTSLAVLLTPGLTVSLTAAPPGSSLSLMPVLQTLVFFQLLPLLLGIAVRHRSEQAAAGSNRFAKPISNLLFAGLVVGLLIAKGHLLVQIGWTGLIVSLGLIAGSLALPLAMPGDAADRAAMSLTTSVRNLSLALLLSSAFFTPLTTITVLAYALFMYLVALPVALFFRGRLPG